MDSLRKRNAFTLIELLTVMAIMAVMLGISIAAFGNLGRGSGMRAATIRTRTSMSQARQNAITHRERTRFTYGNTAEPRGYFYSWETSTGQIIEETNYLPVGFIYMQTGGATAFDDTVEFKLDGSCNNAIGSSFPVQKRNFFITEDRPNGQTNNIVVYAMTGRIKVITDAE